MFSFPDPSSPSSLAAAPSPYPRCLDTIRMHTPTLPGQGRRWSRRSLSPSPAPPPPEDTTKPLPSSTHRGGNLSELIEGVDEEADAVARGALAVVDGVRCLFGASTCADKKDEGGKFGRWWWWVGAGREKCAYASKHAKQAGRQALAVSPRTHVDVAPLPRLHPVAEVAPCGFAFGHTTR